MMVAFGIDALLAGDPPWKKRQKIGLLCNQASVNSRLTHTRLLLRDRFGPDLSCLFSPQHGFNAEKQDNMIESGHTTDTLTGLPVFSLYGETRKPTQEMFDLFDVLLIDLVDVGTRVYTFLYTMAYCLEASARYNKQVVVLDRPNPVGGVAIEGNIVKPEFFSFVGRYPLPMRHGLTFGELAHFINQEFNIKAHLTVVPMSGWKRWMSYRNTGLPWVFPSPNMPTPETAVVYAGQVIWEGTMASEGRGTTLPFELAGAPYWEHEEILSELNNTELPGCYFRPLVFEPTSGKCAGVPCTGFQLHVTDFLTFLPYRASLALLQAVMKIYPEEFFYKAPPYEYEFEKLPMDLILGDRDVRKKLEEGVPLVHLELQWQEELETFNSRRQNYFLY